MGDALLLVSKRLGPTGQGRVLAERISNGELFEMVVDSDIRSMYSPGRSIRFGPFAFEHRVSGVVVAIRHNRRLSRPGQLRESPFSRRAPDLWKSDVAE